MSFGKYKENGFWVAKKSVFRAMFRNHDSLYLALWKLRLRLMKIKGINIHLFFAWYDFWIGVYVTHKVGRLRLYICPIPCCVLEITFPSKRITDA